MPRRSKLAELIGLDKASIESLIRNSVLDAAEIVAEEFRRVLVALQADSENGVFDGYEVVVETEPYTVRKPSLGTLSLIRCHIYVRSPDHAPGGINVFDLLDAGRPALPERSPGQSPYPLWSLSNTTVVSRPGERRRRPGGRFSISSPPSNLRGKRPETLRYKLMGPKPENAQYSPALFVRGPIRAVPPTNLYRRIYNIAKKRLRANGFSHFDLLIVKRRT